MTDRTKTICPPIFDHGGIKKNVQIIENVNKIYPENPIDINEVRNAK